MIIEQVDRNKIKVIVDSDEQKEYGITYETMTFCDINTRRLCESIVERAKNEVGFSVGDSKLLVEAKQGLNGTVTLYLSKIPVSDSEIDMLYGQTVRYESLNDMIDSNTVFKMYEDKIKLKDMYFWNDGYYIYFEMLSNENVAKQLLMNLLEFGEKSTVQRSVLQEHGRLISSFQ